ncbi:hypothetical protein F941_00571 [Acinetobacter bouvetii DSM 14964 = CIP 107468]|uniref:Uncharacterized protein n=1 Tax=Acinetobacter bouvetii DSM 14964 = CIP 107468 TaxID=1120925 RepID=N9DMD5_9GAMM|nr:hypothetical protein [Acinetobacter bouvetii]ENV83874.1 hypothetical protein F941_00571 [Acinetobacter bouvetii DSM 14964 = CIP 107468]BCU65775.1 hypothetical protein ACBO_25660 [Acinetobacter bouvetii]
MSRQVLPKDIKLLYGLSAARCNICEKVLFEPKINEDGYVHIGQMAHNIAYSEHESAPRAIDGLSGDNSYQNLILLCANDHISVDQNTAFYTVEYIRTIKNNFENSVRVRLNNAIRPDKSLVDLIHSNYNLQALIYSLNFPLILLPFNIGDIIDMENFLLEPNRPTSYPFRDEGLNGLMLPILELAHQLNPYIISYYFPSNVGDLRPIREKPIPVNEQAAITNIVQNLYQSIFNWLEYCRINYS